MTSSTSISTILGIESTPTARWNAIREPGLPVIVTYHFPEGDDLPPPSELSREASSTVAFSPAMREAMRAAMDVYERTTGVLFVEQPHAGAMVDIFGAYDTPVGAWATYASSSMSRTGSGVLVVDLDNGERTTGYGFELMLHELGHTMGLSHPHDDPVVLDEHLDHSGTTVMSYNELPEPVDELGWLDVAALYALYGPPVDSSGFRLGFEGEVFHALGGPGADAILGVGGPNMLNGRGGDDNLIGRQGDDSLKGGPGDDSLFGMAGTDKLTGGGGNDLIHGHDAPELNPLGVASSISEDTLKGGGGDDTLIGTAGANVLVGGKGDDMVIADPDDYFGGADKVSGNAGDDTLMGGSLGDTIKGGGGDDLLIGDAVTDRAGNDLILGGGGDDTLRGGYGSDTLLGGGGQDHLIAESASSFLVGDVLDGGLGADTLEGSVGRDTFRFDAKAARGQDVVVGLDILLDKVDLTALGPEDPPAAFAAAGDDTLVRLATDAGEVTILFAGIAPDVLEGNWFSLTWV